MKKFYLALVFFACLQSKGQWSPISTFYTYYYFDSDSWGRDTVFVTGYENGTSLGKIVRTFNGGNLWYEEAVPVNTPELFAITFPTKSVGFAAGQNGTILKTTNTGSFWYYLNSGITQQIAGLWFLDKDTGYACGVGGTLIKTTNGGISWIPKTTGTSLVIHSVCFPTASTGYLVAYSNPLQSGIIMKSSDFGNTWTQQSGPLFGSLNIRGQKVLFTSQDTGMIVGLSGQMLVTTDGGLNWTATGSGQTTKNLNDIFFDELGRGVICGNQGTILKTLDYGSTISDGGSQTTTVDFYTVSMSDDTTGYMFGTNGGALKSGGVFPGMKEYEIESRLKIFPNPASDFITVSADSKIESLSITDLQGKISLSENGNGATKTISVSFLKAGIYFLCVRTDGKTVVKKFLVN
jgi:photosystem II stability/assembly factor-like uncharacterized protein